MKSISFVYWGFAPSKSNYRYAGKDKHARWRRIKQFESDIGWLARSQLPHLGAKPKDVLMWSMPKVTIESFNQKIDADNVSKSLLDSLQHVLYENDRMVAVETIPKKDDEPARLMVTVEWAVE